MTIEEQALDALEAAIAKLANAMKDLRRATDRFCATMSTTVSTTAQLWSSIIAISQLLHIIEHNPNRFVEKLQQDIPGEGVKQQLEALCSIYALSLLKKHLGDFLSTSCITSKQASLANDVLRSLYSQVRPNAVALVDAFNYTDHFLGSVLGRYDGNVYPKLYEEALKDPLNESVVPDGYHEYLRPLLKQRLRTARL